MGGMRKLRRRSRGKQYEVEPLRPQQAFHAGKMSEVILDFAEPLLNAIDDDDELFENAINCAVACWNLSFLPEKKKQRQLRAMVNELGKSDSMARFEVEDCIRMLLERKRFFFANEKRMVLNYEIIEERGSRRLLAMSVFASEESPKVSG